MDLTAKFRYPVLSLAGVMLSFPVMKSEFREGFRTKPPNGFYHLGDPIRLDNRERHMVHNGH